jgi:CSLREA domain-containing protein
VKEDPVRMVASLIIRCGLATIVVVVAGWMLQWPSSGAGAALGVTFVVNSTADSHNARPGDGKCADSAGKCTLRAAVEAADAEPAGTLLVTIKVPAGTYALTLGSLSLTANTISITGTGTGALAGAGSGSTVIQAKGSFRVVNVGSAAVATLSMLTITGGNAGNSGYGGGIYNTGRLTVSGSVVSGNTADAGGGLANAGGTLTVIHTTVTDNSDGNGVGGGGIQNGGLRNVAGLVTVTDSTVGANSAAGDGGGILNGQNGIPASAHGAAVAVRPGCPPGRCAGGPGRPGAGPLPGPGLRLVVTGTQLSGNTSGNAGGGIANDGGVTTVTGSTLTGNSAGGGIGGGIEDYGSLTVKLSTISSNKGSYGGGIEAYDGHVRTPSVATVEQSTLSGNKAAVGGAIDLSTTVNVSASTLTGNRAGQGAGVEVEGAAVNVLNSTITGNVGPGAGIETYACGGGTVGYSTIDGNSQDLSLSCSDLQLTGTIVAGPATGTNCVGAAPAETTGYNVDSGTSCGFTKKTDLSKTGPRLGKLAANGGPTMTQTLLHGSPAINRGGTMANGCPPTDQRGLSRPFGPACDIGAVEVRHT